MRSKTLQLHNILILLTFLAFVSADFEDLFTNIYSISTQTDSTANAYKYSSLEGGSYLYIKGSGFSTRSASSNKVTVGDYDCPVIEYLTTSTQVVCQIPPSPRAISAQVRVFVDDLRIANGGSITYSDTSTPQLIYMLPNAANPGDEIFYYGKQRVDSSLEIDYVKIGDFRCDATEQNEFDSLTFSPNSNAKGPCNVANTEAGYYNVTQKNLESTGLAKKLNTVPTYRFDGTAYDFAVVPRINSISNNKGSPDGQIITIQGTGFSTTGLNEVHLGNTPCNIISQSGTTIQCEVAPVTGTIPDQGYHAGLKFEAYSKKDISTVKAGNGGTPSWAYANLVAEIKSNVADSYASKMSGYFKAPVTGNYKFFVSADDKAQLYFSSTPLVRTGLELIVDVQSVTPYKFFFTKASTSQISAAIPLIADNYYYMEAYHQEGGGDDFATFGVQIPGATNTVNNVPEAQSLKLSCDIEFEVLEFKISNAIGGYWRIRLDYLSSDGKKIDSTSTSTNITYNAAANTVSSAIAGLGLKNTVVKELYANDGTVTTDPAQATSVKFTATLQNFRKNGKLPVIESNNLQGTSVNVKVTQTVAPSSPLRGTFNIDRWGKSAEIAYNAAASTVEQKLRDLGYLDPIRVVQYGDADTGLEWRIQFTGDGSGPVDILAPGTNTLTGCKDPSTISVLPTTLQESSQNLFYEVIPFDLLYTAEANPQITVKSNGITGNCPNYNCDYVIQTNNIPLVSAVSYSPPSVAISIANIATGKYNTSDFKAFFANTECEVLNFDDSLSPITLDINCPNPEAGDFFPKIHFDDIGYAKVAASVNKITIQGEVSSITPTEINPNGGSTLIITGSGFPLSLEIAQLRQLQVQIGNSASCNLETVSPTQITCTTTSVSQPSTITVALNEQLITSSQTLTLSTTIPTIDSVSPGSVNPVLQSDILIAGSNFDTTPSTTKIYLAKPGDSDPITECLVFSTTATEISCKLLGAPTGSYNIYVKTSAGYSNSEPFTVKTTITSVSPSSGSSAGGTLLTIQGGTFSNDIQQTLVFIGDDNVACNVISSTPTEVKCRTQAKSTDYLDGSLQDVVVTTRIVEESYCENGANTCKFSFSDALTPYVTAVSTNSTFPGANIQLTGTGFNSVPSGTAPVVTIGGLAATLVSNTDTSIVFIVPANIVPSKSTAIVVTVTGKGYAGFTDVPNTIMVAPRLDSISPTSGSRSGVLVTFTGAGFHDGIVPKVGNKACEIRSLTSTSLVCKATAQGSASLDFQDFLAVNCTGTCSLTLNPSQTPTISSLSAPTPPSGTFTQTVTGTLFSLTTNTVTLISTTDKTVTFAGLVTPGSATSLTASFTDVPAGTYNVELASDANIATSSVTVSVPLSASTASTVTSSIAGGVSLSITGTGFFSNAQKDKNKVTVCGLPCEVTQSSTTSITCETPLFVNPEVKATYTDVIENSLIEGNTWSDAKQESNVFDLAFTTVYKSSLASCEIGLDVGANLLAQLSSIKYFPDPATTASKLNGTVLEGSNDNSTYSTFAVIDVNAHDGWNTIDLDGASAVRYRYLRLRGGSSTAKCALAELQFFGILLSDNTATDLNAINCHAAVAVGDKTQDAGLAVNYRQTSTPVLTSIDPEMGTSAGGTTITLTGTGFDTTLANVKVTIDDVDCTVATATSTQITCVTGPAPEIPYRRSSLESELKLFFTTNGYAITNDAKYFYIDKWSDESTWGGITPPREGDSVHIPAGQTILLDISPPKLKAIIVEGALIFEDTNIDLHCEYIFIRNGRFQIGTWENPITSKITVTLYGNKDSPQLPTFGNKVLALMEGILDIHGKPRSHTWTLLDHTADQGSTSIVVQGNVDWVAGEEIVIASTDHDHYQSESRTILSVAQDTPSSGLTKITFAEPLNFKHYAAVQTIQGVDFEMRAEVGLLTRNVVIQGDESSKKLMYGAHIMSHSRGDDSSIGRISYTEVRQAGQAFNLGRYAIHFHLIGNTRESYVIGNSIHHSYNRAVTIHGVHYLKVQKNVAYWCMGHTIFIEDGIETHNVIEDNLVVNTIASSALLNTDQTPASFWITNPNNIWRRNHAAGSDRYGFWFDLREHPEGPSATTSICPTGEKLGEFTDNQAHSSGRYGLRIFHELIPRTYPCLPYDDFINNPPVPAEFKNFLGWKNRRDAIIGERLGAVKFTNIKAADNHRAGIEISDGDWSPPFTLTVEDAWIVGVTPDNVADTAVYQEKAVRGLITPKKDYFLAKNVHFYNYGDQMTAIETCSHCEHGAATDAGARTSYFEGLTFNNVQQRVRFNIPLREILIDKDGSLTGNTAGGKGVVTYFYDHLNVTGCTRKEDVYNGLVCDETVTIRKIEFISIAPFEVFTMQNLMILRIEDNPNQDYGVVAYREKPRKSWSVGFVTGYTYKLNWASRGDFAQIKIMPSQVIDPADKTITISFNHSEYRETYDVSSPVNKNITNVTEIWDSNPSSAQCGTWYHDVDNQILYMAINANNRQDITPKAVKCRVNCPLPASAIPKDGLVRLWSNATQWPNQKVPKDGDNVTIPGNWTIRLDVNSAKLNKLHIIGDLFFDETKDDITLTAQYIWLEGQMFIGNDSYNRYTKNAKVLLTGVRNTEGLIIGPVQDVSNKVLAVTGNLTIYGNDVNNVSTRLQAPAKVGDTTITVPSTIDWKVGDDIAIAPTQRASGEFENNTIKAISNGVITLASPIKYFHFGAADVTKVTDFGTLDMRAEVGLLTRNIVIEGTQEDTWGGRLYVGEIYDPTIDDYLRGRIEIEGVEMRNLGQSNTNLAGLTLERLVTENNGPSYVKKCVMRDTEGYQLRVIGTVGATFDSNVFYKSKKYQIRFEDQSTDITFTNNLAIGNQDRGLKADHAKDMITTFYSDAVFAGDSDVSNNIFAGCYGECAIIRGGDCSTQTEGPYVFKNNIGHSAETGLVSGDPNPKCNGITHYTTYKVDLGIVTYFNSKAIVASNLVISDALKGVALNTGVATDTSITLKNSYLAGVTPTGSAETYANVKECSGMAGILIPQSTEEGKSIPPTPTMLPWDATKGNHIYRANFKVTGITIANYKDNIVTGCVNNFAFKTNPAASDYSAVTQISEITASNIGTGNRVYFEEPKDAWVGLDDCGGWHCTGIKNVMIRDTDGTFAGEPTSLMPASPFTIDKTTCYNSANENANICKTKGWGILTFQSLDIDMLTRLVSPVYVTSAKGFSNKVNSYMDHVWDGFYTGLKRLSRFHSVAQSGEAYKVEFTGTPPNVLLWQYQGALDNEGVSVEYGYPNPQSVKVTNNAGVLIKPLVLKTAAERVIQTTDPCGTHLYNVDTRKITIKLTGENDCKLNIALTNSIRVTVRYEITVDEFFNQNGAAAFVDKLAAVLKINPATIRIVDIRSGSTIVDTYVDSSHQDGTTESDAAAKAELNTMMTTLKTAIDIGNLQILNSKVLDSSLSLSMARPESTTTAAETLTSGSSLIIVIIAVVFGVIALAIGSYFAYIRYTKKKVFPADAEKLKLQVKVQPIASQEISSAGISHTENPLYSASSRIMDMSSRSPGITVRSPETSPTKFEAISPFIPEGSPTMFDNPSPLV